ncbi:MAG: PAS domain-containing protein [Bacteroidales bacterium]|nr:PAS domain-containing protein [Bacteroidales bacterium]
MSRQKTSDKSKATNSERDQIVPVINDYPIVGIGASAGGLEALEEFFKNLPNNPGAAFVIIQHLSPDYKSLMKELLQRYTNIPIHVASDGMNVECNHIYLIPPKMNMSIFNRKLQLSEQDKKRTLNLPIDIFFRSLAKDQHKNAIAIVLSGTGSDGALGIRDIKEFGGITMAQDDQSAKFDGMPKSSINTGVIDIISPPNTLAEELINYIKHPFVKTKEKIVQILEKNETGLDKIMAIIRENKGVDFSNYKESTIVRRLEKRMSINQFININDYVMFLTGNDKEIEILFNEMLIGVTRFFREEESFAKLKKDIFPKIFSAVDKNSDIRLWVPGCSTGEEAYSLAIILNEYMHENKDIRSVKIFATDLDPSSIEFASTGIYPTNISTDLTPDRLVRFFINKENGYQIIEPIRNMIVFAKHNVLQDPPFSKINLISCRNLLIYFNNESQTKVLATFHLALKENGYMFLGSSESLGELSDAFYTLDSKNKIYSYKKGYTPTGILHFGTPKTHRDTYHLKSINPYLTNTKNKPLVLEDIFDEILGDYFPPAVLTDSNYNIVHTIHNVNKYLQFPIGQMSINLLKMLNKDLSVIINGLIRRVDKSNTPLTFDNVLKNEVSSLSISCRKIIHKSSSEVYFLIAFIEKEQKNLIDESVKIKSQDINKQYIERIDDLERELQHKSESLQATVEELETSNEELQSSNEELIASNEELQSTNEELQSVNEELYTVNAEHIKKIEEINELYSDLDNLLANTQSGTLFIDRKMHIRKVNNIASQLTKIIQQDIGRSIKQFALDNFYKGFNADIQHVFDTLDTIDREVLTVDGNWYLTRIKPYRTVENAVEGILITFVEISSLKNTQLENIDLNIRLKMALEVGEMTWWEWDIENDNIVSGNLRHELLGYRKSEIGDSFTEWQKLIHPEDKSVVQSKLEEHLKGKTKNFSVEYRVKHKDGHYIFVLDKGSVVKKGKNGKAMKLIGIIMNTSKEKEIEKKHSRELEIADNKIIETENRIQLLFNTIKIGVVFQNKNGEITQVNPAAERILGLSIDQMNGKKSIDPDWKSIRVDGSNFPGEQHPSMQALKTGKVIENVVMGIYNPKIKKHVWIKINAYPLKTGKNTYMAYTTFEEIVKPN